MSINKLHIESGSILDLDELEQLYNDLNDYLSATVNYPGWIKGIYPVRESAASGLADNALYVAKYNGQIVGSVVLNHAPEEAYASCSWKVCVDYDYIFVLRTFVVHPSFLKIGIGKALLDFSVNLARQNGIQAIRLDVFDKNTPAMALYEKVGFEYVGKVDLGLSHYGLDWFSVYEKVIK